MKPLSIYVHIPFCKKKCLYCDFPSYAGMENIYEDYTNTLVKEIKNKSYDLKQYEIKTIFFGGGTPTLLPESLTEKIITSITSNYNISKYAEITTEANPATFDSKKLSALISMGFNRISIGLQAWQNQLLKTIGRIHTSEQFQKSYYTARDAGFKNINIDVMFSLPNQTIYQWNETLENIISLKPEHISCYSLILEENTPLYEQRNLFKFDDEEDRNMYHTARSILYKNGYNQYEISNFAKNGFECKHNIVYWQTEEYLGFGLSSHSFINGIRFNNTYNIKKYLSCDDILENKIILSEKDKYEEFMFMGLRMTEGISTSHFKIKFGIDAESIYKDTFNWLLENRLLYKTQQGYALTLRGIDLSNIVFEKFLL